MDYVMTSAVREYSFTFAPESTTKENDFLRIFMPYNIHKTTASLEIKAQVNFHNIYIYLSIYSYYFIYVIFKKKLFN